MPNTNLEITREAVSDLQREEAALMTRWERRWQEKHSQYPHFNADGIVDHERWRSLPAGGHILVILKETNGLTGSLAEFLRGGGSSTCYRTWNNVVRWAKMILENTYCESVPRAVLDDAVKNIAAINLKKYAGGSTADRKVVRREASADIDLLREQIRLYRPDIILTGGWGLVSDFVHDDIFAENAAWDYNSEREKRDESDPDLWYYWSDKIREDKRVLVVSMPHPNRASKEWTLELRKCLLTSGFWQV